MRRGEIFWGGLLVILGGLFLLKAAGYIGGDVLGWFWPLFIVAAGVWVLLEGAAPGKRSRLTRSFSVALQGATEASLTIEHGAGRLELGSGASSGDFLTGEDGVAMDHSVRLEGQRLDVRIQAGPSFVPFIGPAGGVWQYRLNADVPTTLSISSGASSIDVDLTELRVTHFSFEGGASRLRLVLPAVTELTLAEIEAGAAGIDVRVPEGVALRLRTESVGSLDVDPVRFPRREAGLYQSTDFDGAGHRADLRIDGGATSIRVH